MENEMNGAVMNGAADADSGVENFSPDVNGPSGSEEDGAELLLDESLDLGEDVDVDDEGDIVIGVDEEESDTGEDDGAEGSEELDEDEELERAFAEAFSDDEDDENSGEKSDAASAASEEERAPAGEDTSTIESSPTSSEGEAQESEEIAELRRRLADAEAKADKLERRAKDALSGFGIESDDVVADLERLAREQSDMTEEEYKTELERRDTAAAEEKRETLRRAEQERQDLIAKIGAKKAADIAAIHAAYPGSAKYKSVDDIPNSARFKELRDGGASPEEAYAAVNSAEIAEAVSERAHRATLHASKSHIQSVRGKSAGGSVKIPASEYRMIKGLLGDDVSNTEIAKYYKKVKGK